MLIPFLTPPPPNLHRCCYLSLDDALLCCWFLFTVRANNALISATGGVVSVIFSAFTAVLATGGGSFIARQRLLQMRPLVVSLKAFLLFQHIFACFLPSCSPQYPPPPVSNECFVQRTLLFRLSFFGT